jgi:hypothetical protein
VRRRYHFVALVLTATVGATTALGSQATGEPRSAAKQGGQKELEGTLTQSHDFTSTSGSVTIHDEVTATAKVKLTVNDSNVILDSEVTDFDVTGSYRTSSPSCPGYVGSIRENPAGTPEVTGSLANWEISYYVFIHDEKPCGSPQPDYSTDRAFSCKTGDTSVADGITYAYEAATTYGPESCSGTLRSDSLTISGTVQARDCGATCTVSPLAGVAVTADIDGEAAGSDTTDASGEYEINVEEPGTYFVTPEHADHEFTPNARTVNVDGRETGIDFKTCSPTPAKAARREVTGPLCRRFELHPAPPTGDELADRFPVRLLYKGFGWDPRGGRIAVSWDGKVFKRFQAASNFQHRLFASEWPRRNLAGCWGVIKAEQDGVSRGYRLTANPVADVIFADRDAVFSTGDRVCQGEGVTLELTRGTVITYRKFDTGAFNIYRRGSAPLEGVNFGTRMCVELVPKTRGYVLVKKRPDGGLDVARRASCADPL